MKLLVSVRSVAEAVDALESGADLIDIKEPERGSLGKADDATIAAIVEAVARRRPVSAAYGELRESAELHLLTVAKLDFIKFGLADVVRFPWRDRLIELRCTLSTTVVPTAYADWNRAGSPTVERVAAFVVEKRFPVMLIDTWIKDGRKLFSWLEPERLGQIVGFLHKHGCKAALAGSLSESDLTTVARIQPDWVAVRGAVCAHCDRRALIDAQRVRAFKNAVLTSDIPGPS
jgi:(5-formylfuran-3-yl)methyl phosphate synthase